LNTKKIAQKVILEYRRQAAQTGTKHHILENRETTDPPFVAYYLAG